MQKDKSEKANWALLDTKKPNWHLSSTNDLPKFLRALPQLIPANAVIYFEAGSPDREIKTFFNARCLSGRPIIPMGTISPKPAFFHLPITEQNLYDLAEIAERHSEYEIAGHIHIYINNEILLQWFDAFSDPIYISGKIDEDKIKSFAAALNLEYQIESQI